MSENPLDLAGASREPDKDTPVAPREVFPVTFEKDYKDYRPVAADQPDEGELAPKSSSALVSVESPQSPTGLEDVSEEDLANPALPNAEKDKNPKST